MVRLQAITASEPTLRQLLANRGVVPILTASFQGTDSVIAKALVKAKDIRIDAAKSMVYGSIGISIILDDCMKYRIYLIETIYKYMAFSGVRNRK